MGIKISDSRSFGLEPVRKNRFFFQFSKIPGSSNEEQALAFVCKSASVPQMTFETDANTRFHESFNTASKVTFNPLNVVFNDYIRNSSSGEQSAADIMYAWATMIYNPLTGQMGYATQYKTSATEGQLDPAGNVFRAWNIFGIFPKNVTFGDNLSYEDAGRTEVTCEFAYDLAIKVNDSQSQSESR